MKILYLSHIDWGWIKQRPQFLAEHLLNEGFDCQVYYQKSRNRRHIRSFQTEKYHPRSLWKIPLKNKSRALMRLNELIQETELARLIKSIHPDLVWVTHPEFYDLLPHGFQDKLAYDCMDDVVEFYHRGSWISEYFLAAEAGLLRRADYAFFASEHLKRTVLSRAKTEAEVAVVRNAYEMAQDERLHNSGPVERPADSDTPPVQLGYFGTISTWFDFEALTFCCKSHPRLRIDLYGPLETPTLLAKVPNNIRYMGIIPHSALRETSQQYDALIMPFTVTDLIQSVDPVKLYEYIDFNRPIITVYYPEIQRFDRFVSFYRTKEELAVLLGRSCSDLRRYSVDERIDFLRENAWSERAKQIRRVLLPCE